MNYLSSLIGFGSRDNDDDDDDEEEDDYKNINTRRRRKKKKKKKKKKRKKEIYSSEEDEEEEHEINETIAVSQPVLIVSHNSKSSNSKKRKREQSTIGIQATNFGNSDSSSDEDEDEDDREEFEKELYEGYQKIERRDSKQKKLMKGPKTKKRKKGSTEGRNLEGKTIGDRPSAMFSSKRSNRFTKKISDRELAIRELLLRGRKVCNEQSDILYKDVRKSVMKVIARSSNPMIKFLESVGGLTGMKYFDRMFILPPGISAQMIQQMNLLGNERKLFNLHSTQVMKVLSELESLERDLRSEMTTQKIHDLKDKKKWIEEILKKNLTSDDKTILDDSLKENDKLIKDLHSTTLHSIYEKSKLERNQGGERILFDLFPEDEKKRDKKKQTDHFYDLKHSSLEELLLSDPGSNIASTPFHPQNKKRLNTKIDKILGHLNCLQCGGSVIRKVLKIPMREVKSAIGSTFKRNKDNISNRKIKMLELLSLHSQQELIGEKSNDSGSQTEEGCSQERYSVIDQFHFLFDSNDLQSSDTYIKQIQRKVAKALKQISKSNYVNKLGLYKISELPHMLKLDFQAAINLAYTNIQKWIFAVGGNMSMGHLIRSRQFMMPFAELAAIYFKREEYDEKARNDGKRYHPARNKEIYEKQIQEKMRYWNKYRWDGRRISQRQQKTYNSNSFNSLMTEDNFFEL